MTLESRSITGGERLRNILESLDMPIVSEDGESFTVRRFVFYCVKSEGSPQLVDRNVLRNEHLQRLGFLPVPFPESMLLNFKDVVAWIIQSYMMCEKEAGRQ